MNSFRHTVTDEGDHTLLTLSGDLDFAAHADLEAQLVSLVETGRAVVVDCSGITFLDSMGLRALVAGLVAAEDAGQRFELAAPSPPVLRVLDLSGTLERFHLRQSAPEPLEG
jgi:anti-sigma B factor antagonist